MWASECAVYARNSGALDSIGGRNENKADAAFGEGIAVDWDSTGYFSLPVRSLSSGLKQKMSEFCDARVRHYRQDASICEVPLSLEREGLAEQTLDLLQLEQRQPDLTQWQTLVERLYRPTHRAEIGIVGKYVQLGDAYSQALRHAAIAMDGDLTCAGSTLKT